MYPVVELLAVAPVNVLTLARMIVPLVFVRPPVPISAPLSVKL